MSELPFEINPHIAAAPLYVTGTSIAETREQFGLDVVTKLASNESPIGPSPRALEAIAAALGRLHRYPAAATDDLRDRLAEHYGGGLTADHFVTGRGAVELIDMISRAFLREGDNVIISRPTFPLYQISAARLGAQTRAVPTDASFGVDAAGILGAIDERTRVVWLCTPNNPTGTLIAPALLERLANDIPARVILVIDEAYRVFVDDPEGRVDARRLVAEHPNLLSLRSFSKAYGLAGIRLGYAFGQPGLATYLRRLRHPFHCGDLELAAAIAALEDDAHRRRLREVVIAGRADLTAGLSDLGLEVIPSQTNFVTARAPWSADVIYHHLLREGVIIRPLGLFYMPQWFRVTVGSPDENARFLRVLRLVLDNLETEGVSPDASYAAGGKVMV